MREADFHKHCPEERGDLFTSPGPGATEDEVQELLTALVRCYKPELVLETGTCGGDGTVALALGCRKNGFGKVISIEYVEKFLVTAKKKAEAAEVGDIVEFVHANSVEWLEKYSGPPFGFMFLDTLLTDRVRELDIAREKRLAVGPVMVHDTSRHRSKTMNDCPEFPAMLDRLGIPSVESNLSRGWRLFDLSGRAAT